MTELKPLSSDELGFRQAPCAIEVEQALLGAMLVNNKTVDKVSHIITPDDFYEEVHGRVYDAVIKLVGAGKSADAVKLKPYFEGDEGLADVGGTAYLVRLAASAATIINSYDYAMTIADLSARRKIIEIGEEMVNTAYDSPIDHPAETQIEDAEVALRELATGSGGETGMETIGDAMTRAMDDIDKSHETGVHPGLTTGLADLDKRIGGLHPTDLIFIGGRPGMLKTTLGENIAKGAALSLSSTTGNHRGSVGFYSLEMANDQLATRMITDLCFEDKIDYSKARTLKLSAAQRHRMREMVNLYRSMPLITIDRAAMTLSHITSSCRRLAAIQDAKKQPLKLVVVDYLQLITFAKGQFNEVAHLSECSRGFKLLAKELKIPVIVLSQLNRQVEMRENKRPMLSDLRGSGTIEQDADMVLFTYREHEYLKKEQPKSVQPLTDAEQRKHDEWLARMHEVENVIEVIICKQRHGPTGFIELAAFAGYGSIRDRSQQTLI